MPEGRGCMLLRDQIKYGQSSKYIVAFVARSCHTFI